MAEAGLRMAMRPQTGSALEYVGRVRYVGMALAAVGALDEAVAEAIAGDFETAVAIRSREGRGNLVPHRIRPRTRGSQATATGTAGSVWAGQIGQMLRLRSEDMTADLWLLSLIRTATQTAFSVTGRIHRLGPRGSFGGFQGISAVDHQGRTYYVHYSGGVGVDQTVDGRLDLHPELPSGVPWVEFYVDSHQGAILRVDLTAGPTAGPVTVEPTGTFDAAGRLLDAVAEGLLVRPPSPDVIFESPDELVAGLEAAGALPPRSLAASRLAALCQQAGLDAGGRLAAELAAGERPAAELPESWTSVLAYLGRRHRPAVKPGIAPVTVVLPELNGIRFALAGLRSGAESTLLTVVGAGLPEMASGGSFGLHWYPWLPWSIRDSGGQWHVTELRAYESYGSEYTTLRLQLVPPLARSVTRLEVVVPGRGARVRASVPVDWMDGYE